MKTINDLNCFDDMMNSVICGDCIEGMKKIPNNSIDLILTDPPYGIGFISHHRSKKYNEIQNDNNLNWLSPFLEQIARIGKLDSHFYCFCSHHNIEIFKSKIKDVLNYKSILIWEKNNTSMGDLYGDYASKHEFIIFCNGGKKLNGKRDPAIIKEKKTGNNFHPTEKPVYLIEYLIEKSTNKDDIVLDPFMGSWTTARAAKNSQRNFIGFEISEKFCQIGEERLKQEILPF